jgi:nucleoside phosphorylase
VTQTYEAASLRGDVDFVVITIREDEYEAVRTRFAPCVPVYGRQHYQLCQLRKNDGSLATVALVRSFNQGHSAAVLVTQNAIDDLSQKWVVVAGIAGAIPHGDFTLGDVLLADSIHDFAITAAHWEQPVQYRTGGGPMHSAVERLLAGLQGIKGELGNWNDEAALRRAMPAVVVPKDFTADCYYGSEDERKETHKQLVHHFGGVIRKPDVAIGAVASANVLVKDPEVISSYLSAARHITHIEMEVGGAYIATHRAQPNEIPLLSVRGISDVVGFKRSGDWTQFACDSAASFLHALLRIAPNEAFGIKPSGFAPRADRAPSVEAILSAFAKSSAPLLSRVVAVDERIPRPEAGELESQFLSESGKVLCVLGSPGSGKTAFMALLAQNAAKEGIACLAFKADLLPKDSPFTGWGNRDLGIDMNALDAVQIIASRGRVLVMVDQLDALSSIVAVSSDLFNSVVDFIRACAAIPNVMVVCSCRDTDFNYDARFGELQAQVVSLSLPPWEEVAKQLAFHGIQGSENWQPKFRDVLRTPQHLRIYLDRYNENGRADFVGPYHMMLDDLWERNVTIPKEQELVDALTKYSMDHEVLWAPTAAFESSAAAIRSLRGKGLLESEGPRFGFKHQTLLEHAKARYFTKSEQSFRDYVVHYADTLQVRPTVLAVLQYLRDARPEKYRTELEALFAADLRLHLRYLLIEFLGQVAGPEAFEKALMAERLEDTDDQVRVLLSIAGNLEWFAAFRSTHFPTIMQQDVQNQWPMVGVINAAWKGAHAECLDLVSAYWFSDPAKDELTLSVMQQLDRWDTREFEMACALVRRATPIEGRLWWAEHFVSLASASRPDLAPRLFIVTMEALDAHGDGLTHSPLELHNDWYDLPEVAEAAPVDFLRAGWSWVVDICTGFHNSYSSSVLYRYDGYCMSLDETDYRPESPVLAAFVAAIEATAKAEPAVFVEITKSSWESENGVVHRLIQLGLASVAATMPGQCLQYLAGDRRRLWVGSRESQGQSESMGIISALARSLAPAHKMELESLIVDYSQYRDGQTLSAEQVEWDREARLRLLDALPADLQSAEVSQLIESEKLALPGWDRPVPAGRSGFVREVPPMNKEEMASASGDQIVKVMRNCPEQSREQRKWKEVEGGWEEPGGALAAARVVAELAKDNPQKAVEIIERLVAEGMEDAAARASSGLSKTAITDEEVLAFARTLIAAGITTGDLRREVACSVYSRSNLPHGIPDDICAAIVAWLEADAAKVANPQADKQDKLKIRDDGNSVLWGDAGIELHHTAGNSFWFLLAITEGYLRRSTPRAVDWANLIERLLAGYIPERTWTSFCSEFRWIGSIDLENNRGSELVAALFARFPDMLNRREGVYLIARVSPVLPESQLRALLAKLRAESVPIFRQQYGELLALIAFRDKEHAWARDLLEAELTDAEDPGRLDDAIAAGIAHTAANLWDEPTARVESVRVLTRLIPIATTRIGDAISSVFLTTHDFAADDTTELLLQTLAANPEPLGRIPVVQLIPHLATLLPHKRKTILALCHSILASRADWRELHDAGPQLVEVSMTLQRFPDTAADALDLFEQLLRRGLNAAFRVLREIDSRPFDTAQPERPRRRRRRRRKPREGT